MKKLFSSAVVTMLVTSLAYASTPEELLESAIKRGDLQAVQTLAGQGLDLNKGLGIDRKPALMFAVERLGADLKEVPDYAWYLIGAGFGGVALGGIYKIVTRKSEPVINVTSPVESATCSTQKPPQLVGKSGRAKRVLRGVVASSAGALGVLGSLRKAKEQAPKRTSTIEDRLRIVKFLAQQPGVNIFTPDAHNRSAVDLVISYLSNYTEGSECYECMQEVKESLTARNKKDECPCVDCVCVDCSCSHAQECVQNLEKELEVLISLDLSEQEEALEEGVLSPISQEIV